MLVRSGAFQAQDQQDEGEAPAEGDLDRPALEAGGGGEVGISIQLLKQVKDYEPAHPGRENELKNQTLHAEHTPVGQLVGSRSTHIDDHAEHLLGDSRNMGRSLHTDGVILRSKEPELWQIVAEKSIQRIYAKGVMATMP